MALKLRNRLVTVIAKVAEAVDHVAIEAERQGKRRGIKLKLAERAVLTEKYDALRAEVDRILAVIRQATDAHQEACTPLQQELAELERQAIGRIADRQPVDAEADARRAEIMRLVAAENEKLEQTSTTQNRLRVRLERECNGISTELSRLPLEPMCRLSHRLRCHRRPGGWSGNRSLTWLNSHVRTPCGSR